MTTLIVGASGATGKLLVEQLLVIEQKIKIIVRPASNIPDSWKNNNNITIIYANISKISVEEMSGYIKDCHAAASCLGHNLTLKGLYGHPRRLVTDAVNLIHEAIKMNTLAKPIKFVLMNTAGNSNRDLNEPLTIGEKLLTALLRIALPPLVDNENAADYLRVKVGQNNPNMEWVAVRPDSLIDKDEVTKYSEHVSPIRSALFNPGKTSRINVANFMSRLISDENVWNKWKGQMPVIYNEADSKV